MTSSIYIHVPFCAGSCDYCDFYSVTAADSDERLDRSVENLLDDVSRSIQSYGVSRVPTLYIGGGTPSLLGPERFARLQRGIRAVLPNEPAEIGVEANPESASPDFLRACADSGATRLSLGIQSTDENARRAVGRIGTAARARAAVADARRLFPGSLSLDLIAGLPLQSSRSLLDDVAFAVESGADHVSLYSLTLEEGTPLFEKARRRKVRLPSADEADELWMLGADALEAAGFRQYEVSNFSIPGKESRHNERYWRMESYLGCGPGAVGTLVDEEAATARRLSWPRDVDSWLRGQAAPELEFVDRKAFLSECLLMGFRTIAGVDDELFRRRFGRGADFFVGRALAARRAAGLARDDRPALTREGLLTLNPFLIECLSELDESYPRYEDSLR